VSPNPSPGHVPDRPAPASATSIPAGPATPSAAAPPGVSPAAASPTAASPARASAAAAPAPVESFPPAVQHTLDWLQNRFRNWYKVHPPALPDRFTRREFGFLLWPDRPGAPPFLRHRGYGEAGRLHNYLAWKGPHSAYYSTAYYRRPGEMKMVDKQWLGAELIFDLDADHLPEAEAAKARGEEMPIVEQLARVKVHFKRLLDEFLFGDLGIDEKDLFITFSGGRGYHAHVTDARLLGMDAKARREIVDYVTGKVPAVRGSTEPDLSAFVWKEAVATEGRGKFQKTLYTERMAPTDAPGWRGRMTRALVTTLRERVLDASHDAARAWLISLDGVGAKSADAFLADFDEARLRRIGQGYLEQGKVVKKVCHHILEQQAIPFAKGETDEPVTADVKRLIRLPGSLHGKTGLSVVTLSRDELNEFEPLRDAVGFSVERTVAFQPRGADRLTLGGVEVAVEAGAPVEVPEAHAVWWCARRQGTIPMD
jgi:DNA primase small subunit